MTLMQARVLLSLAGTPRPISEIEDELGMLGIFIKREKLRFHLQTLVDKGLATRETQGRAFVYALVEGDALSTALQEARQKAGGTA